MTEPDIEILPADDDDDFLGDNIVSSGQVMPLPVINVSPDMVESSDPIDKEDDFHTPGVGPDIVDPDEYDRENATVAPDGSALTEQQIAKPWLFRRGDPPKGGRIPRAANRINVREMVQNLSSKTMLNPIEILFYIMNANDESRAHLGLRKSDRISANLRAKCGMELLNYMAPKLKSVEVKSADGDGGKDTGVKIFLPANTREQGQVAEQPILILPEKDGVTVPFSPEIATQLLLGDDDEDEQVEEWMGAE